MISITPVSDAAIGTVQTPILVGPALRVARTIGRYLIPLPQPLGSELLFATGQGVVVAAVEIVNGAPAIRFHSCPDVDVVYRRLVELEQPVMHLTAAPADPSVPPEPGRCRICGCTMEAACPCGCWWADETGTLCKQHGT